MSTPGIASIVVAAEKGGDFTDINPRTALMTIVAFAITYLILSKLAWPKLAAAIEARELRIVEGLRKAEEAEERAQALMEQQRSVLDEARTEAQQLLATARAAAEQEASAMIRAAHEERLRDWKEAREMIRREQAQALEELKQAAVDLTLLISSQVAKRNFDGPDDRSVAEEIVEELAGTGAAEPGAPVLARR
ncbi:MAG: F0F1 ATP synthase subunit B [Actinomycetota bacterium]|jgi:F-type H+-transporting ATPase subunit b